MEYNLKTTLDETSGTLTLETTIANQIHKELVELKDKEITTALIQLGWTPPNG